MKTLCLLPFIAALIATLCNAQQEPAAIGELRGLPEVVLDRKSEFQARYQVLEGGESGVWRYGFAFKTPNLVDGSATWRVVWDHTDPDASAWEVTKPDGSGLARCAPKTEDISRHPDLAAAYPQGKSVQTVKLHNHLIVKATRYQAVLATRSEKAPLGISINVALSGLGVPPGSKPVEMRILDGDVMPRLVMELVENIRTFRGDEEAIRFLEKQFSLKADRLGEFSSLFYLVWNEAQFGQGMENSVWGSRLNDAAFISAYRIGHFGRAFEIMNNLCARLGSAARFGRLAEVHAILEDAYASGGMNMDPSSYPDLGPAIPGLPTIRHRDISMKTAWSVRTPGGPPPISRVVPFNEMQAGALLQYAFQRSNRGDWKGALEWSVWIRDWASDENGVPLQARNGIWYSATHDLALLLSGLGYNEEALALIEEAVAAPYGMNYRGRAKIHAANLQLDLKRRVGRPDPESIPKLRELIIRIENHVHFGKSGAWSAKIDLAEALYEGGETAEAERIIEEIIREGSYNARWTRLDRWLKEGRTEGVEAELIAMLKSTREFGHKISELGLYSRYADFLETAGRFDEALAMRREAIRLARDFNGFTKLPGELAKLAALLHKLGHAELAAAPAAEARGLVAAGNLPPSTVESVNKSLAAILPAAPQQPLERQPDVDLQPQRGLVIPLEGAPWSGYLTLTNPGAAAIRGSLEISGAPMTATVDDESGDILVKLANAKGDGRSVLPLTLAPGSYRLITVAAGAEETGVGELAFAWRSTDGGNGAEAALLIDMREEGVGGAVIQAGDYRANPFYGVPIHLSYIAKDRRPKSPPIRFKASQAARIEIHRLDGTPLAVDGSGNGSLLDAGDEVFSETDGSGNLMLALADAAAALRIVAYPEGRIDKDGLRIEIEVFDGGAWVLHSSNRVEP